MKRKTDPPLLSIIIVNWKSAGYLRDCIRSIELFPPPCAWEVIVVDSASFDGCGEMLKREFPTTRFIQATTNLGFARANNLGAKHAAGRFRLFLNPDTKVLPGALAELMRAAESAPGAGAVGARLLNGDETLQTSCVKAFPTIGNEFLSCAALQRRFPHSRLWGMDALYRAGDTPQSVDVVSGACILMTRDCFDSLGGWNESFFMFSEDVDLCFQSRSKGFTNYYVPTARIVHYGGSSTSQQEQSQFANVMMRESRWRYFRSRRGSAYAVAYRLAIAATALLRLIVAGTGVMFVSRLKSSVHKWTAILGWVVIPTETLRRCAPESVFALLNGVDETAAVNAQGEDCGSSCQS